MRSLRDRDGREQLLDEVWGPKSVRRRIKEASRAGVAGSTGGGFLNACSGCDIGMGDDLGFLAAIVVLFVLIGLVWFVGSWLIDWWRRRHAMRTARGARKQGARCGPRTEQIGRIVATRAAEDPLTLTPCVAFGAVLVQDKPAPQIMLRDAATVGFEVELDSGERVRIPAGACVIDVPDRYVGTDGVERYRLELDPQRIRVDDLEPFPCDRIAHVTLEAGQRVEVVSELEPVAPGDGGTYRSAPRSVLAPRGVARLRPC
ncbi:MAG TPA: hypothetical protein VLB44_04810 [Kofleriaceae bacterium]|nr:hypothetical protein [Kofleriaceae bacterium]